MYLGLILALLGAGGFAYTVTRTKKPGTPSLEKESSIQPTLLDVGLSLPEIGAVNWALRREAKSANLDDFSNTFFPLYPIAGSLLHSRALSIGFTNAPINSALTNAARVPLSRSIKTPLQPTTLRAKGVILSAGIGRPIVHGVATVGKKFAAKPSLPPDPEYFTFWPNEIRAVVPHEWSGDIAKIEGVPMWWRNYEMTPGMGRSYFNTSGLEAKLNDLKRDGLAKYMGEDHVYDFSLHRSLGEEITDTAYEVGDVIKNAGPAIGMILKALAPIVGLIPGIGSGIAVAMSIAGSLALGQNISDALLDAAANAIPGGGLVKMGIDGGITATKGIIKNKRFDRTLMDVARKEVEDAGGPMAAAAFDAGVAIMQGKNIQDAGFQVYYAWVKGNDIAEKTGFFTEHFLKSLESGKSVSDIMIDATKEAMLNVANSPQARAYMLDNVVTKLVKNPDELQKTINQFAEENKVPIDVAQAAFMSVRDMGNGTVVVVPEIRKRFDTVTLMPDRPMLTATLNRIQGITQKGKEIVQSAKVIEQFSKLGIKTDEQRMLEEKAVKRAQWVERYRKEAAAQAA